MLQCTKSVILVKHLFTLCMYDNNCISLFTSGGCENREWPHKSESSWAGWLSGSVQNQEAHTPQQTDESILWETGKTFSCTFSCIINNPSVKCTGWPYLPLGDGYRRWVCLEIIGYKLDINHSCMYLQPVSFIAQQSGSVFAES